MPDLKKPSAADRVGAADRRGWGMRAAVAGVLVVLGIAIGWGLYGNTTSPLSFTSDPGAKSDGIPAKVITPPKQLQSLGGLNGLLEQMRQRFGDTMGYSLPIYPEYAVLDRADPNDDRRKLSYNYRGGFDDPSTSARADDDVLVDLAAFDVEDDGRHPAGRGRDGRAAAEGRRRQQHLSHHRPRRRSGEPRRPGAASQRLERLRQRIHHVRRRRHHQAHRLRQRLT